MSDIPRSRNPVLDISKGVAMLLVLYGHALGLFFEHVDRDLQARAFFPLQVIYSFHMPLFFLLSGMVFRPRGLREALRRSLSLLLAAYLVHLVCWLGSSLLAGGRPDVGALLLPLVRLRGFYSVIVWFLAALALVQLVYFLLVSRGWVWRLGLLLLVAGGFAWTQRHASTLLQLQALAPGLLFFAIGHRVARVDLARPVRGARWPWLLPALLAAAGLATLNGGCAGSPGAHCDNVPVGFVVLMVTGQYGFYPWFLLAALAGSLAVLWLAAVLLEQAPRLSALLAWTGRRSLQLMVINGLVIHFAHPLLERRFTDAGLGLAIVLSLALCAVQLLAAYRGGTVTAAPLRIGKYLADRLVPGPAAGAGQPRPAGIGPGEDARHRP